jgi:chromosome condensin MukBEF MukE localization factor
MTHLAEGLCFNELLTLKVENSLICLVGTRIATMSKMEGQFILSLKEFIRNKASRCRRLELSVLKLKKK